MGRNDIAFLSPPYMGTKLETAYMPPILHPYSSLSTPCQHLFLGNYSSLYTRNLTKALDMEIYRGKITPHKQKA